MRCPIVASSSVPVVFIFVVLSGQQDEVASAPIKGKVVAIWDGKRFAVSTGGASPAASCTLLGS